MHTTQGEIQILYRIEVQTLLIDCHRYDLVTEIEDRESERFVSTATPGKNNIASLTLSIRVVCKESYTGSDCGNMICEPRDDSTGHFTCDINGKKVCLPGYQNPGTNCVEAVTIMIPTTTMEANTMETVSVTTQTFDNGYTTMTYSIQTTPPPSTTTSAPAPVGMDIVPIAAGAAVGGLVVILILIVIIAIAVLLVAKAKNKRTIERIEGS